MSNEQYNAPELLEQFREFLRVRKRAAENTLASYTRDLNRFLAWAEREGISLSELTAEQAAAYRTELEQEGKSAATISRSLASLRCFCRYLCEKGILQQNPAVSVRTAPSEKKAPGVLTREEVLNLLRQPDLSDPRGLRDRAILELIYATGIRVSELAELEEEDLNLSAGILLCRGGRKDRVLPIYRGAVRALREYLKKGRPALAQPEEHALFVNRNGTGMTRQGLWKILRGYQESAGITVEVSPQNLRNSFAAHMLENGADIRAVQELLGHNELYTTQVYARQLSRRTAEAYNSSHPLAGVQKRP